MREAHPVRVTILKWCKIASVGVATLGKRRVWKEDMAVRVAVG